MLRPQPPRTASRARGFTLIELIVVVIIIGVFAAMAIPQVTLRLQDRRVHETAQRIALVYQQARMRAMGQGGAVLVRFGGGATGNGSFETLEGLAGAGASCPLLPVASCTQTNWDDAARAQFRSIETMDLGGAGSWTYATLVPDSQSASPSTVAVDVCFTPLGRAFVRYGAGPGDPFVPLTGVPSFQVARRTAAGQPAVGRVREVLVLPTGIARLKL